MYIVYLHDFVFKNSNEEQLIDNVLIRIPHFIYLHFVKLNWSCILHNNWIMLFKIMNDI